VKTKKQSPFQVRQGDVFLERVSAIPANLKPRKRDKGRVILAYGEVTGHAHAIAEPDSAALFDGENGEFYLRIESATGLVHEEHARIDLPEGLYRGRIQREWTDADEPRQVLD
jgi:hypothetical protein